MENAKKEEKKNSVSYIHFHFYFFADRLNPRYFVSLISFDKIHPFLHFMPTTYSKQSWDIFFGRNGDETKSVTTMTCTVAHLKTCLQKEWETLTCERLHCLYPQHQNAF